MADLEIHGLVVNNPVLIVVVSKDEDGEVHVQVEGSLDPAVVPQALRFLATDLEETFRRRAAAQQN